MRRRNVNCVSVAFICPDTSFEYDENDVFAVAKNVRINIENVIINDNNPMRSHWTIIKIQSQCVVMSSIRVCRYTLHTNVDSSDRYLPVEVSIFQFRRWCESHIREQCNLLYTYIPTNEASVLAAHSRTWLQLFIWNWQMLTVHNAQVRTRLCGKVIILLSFLLMAMPCDILQCVVPTGRVHVINYILLQTLIALQLGLIT